MLVLPDGAGPVCETERRTRGTSVVKLLDVLTGSNLADMARGAVRTHRCGGELLNRSWPSGKEAAGNVYGVPVGEAAGAKKVIHLGDGFDFLGYHIQWRPKRGTNQRHVYTYPSKKALTSIKTKLRTLTNQKAHPDLKTLLVRVNQVARGWCHYFKYGSSSATFGYLNHYLWWRTGRWLRKRHSRLSWSQLRRKVFTDGYRIVADGIELFNPASVATVHERWRGYEIPTPGHEQQHYQRHEPVESRMR